MEKILVIEDTTAGITMIEKFYQEYYPKPVELDIIDNFKDAEEKIQNIILSQNLWTYNYILMDGRLHGQFTDSLIISLLQEEDVPPIISISWIPDQSKMYLLPYAQKGFFEDISTSLYSILLWNEIQLKNNMPKFEDSHLNGLIDHTVFENRSDDRWYRKAIAEKLLPKTIKQPPLAINNNDNKDTNNSKQKKPSFLKKILSGLSRKQS